MPHADPNEHKEYHARYRANPVNKERQRAYGIGYRKKHKPVILARLKAWRADPKNKIKQREYHQKCVGDAVYLQNLRLKRYRITALDYQRMLDSQQGKCAICLRRLEAGKNTHVDHDHATGKVRGLLCRVCNSIEGFIRKTKVTPVEFGKRLAAYLAKYQ